MPTRRGARIGVGLVVILIAGACSPGHQGAVAGGDAGHRGDSGGNQGDVGETNDGECVDPALPAADEVADGAPALVAARTDEPVTVDGSLDDAIYDRAPAVEFSDGAGDSDNEVEAYSAWDEDRLYFGFDVEDGERAVDEEASFNTSDGMELFVDVDNQRGAEPDGDHHWLLRADGETLTELYADGEAEPDTDLNLGVATGTTADGWTLELSVDAGDIELEPADGTRLGVAMLHNDRDEGNWNFFWWDDSMELKTPSTYGELVLATASCPGEDSGDDGGDGNDGNGEPVEPCVDGGDFEELPVDGPVPLGGGPDYGDLVCEEEADTVVSTREGLKSALEEADAGDVVFVDPGAEIDMGFDADFTVPDGVTLSGGRGCGCRAGALLYTDEDEEEDYDHETILSAGSESRITGLRIRGMRTPGEWIAQDEMSHYLDGRGINVVGADAEIDNNEVWGFAHAGISAGTGTRVHHNHLHDMVRDGLGYGVNGGDDVLIEYNYFDWVRHAVASGDRNSYEARYNHMGSHAISHVYDMHPEGGETVEIHHNTVEAVDNMLKNKKVPAVTIRGTPSDTADVYDNWFFNPEEPREEPVDSWTDEAVVQMHVTEWTNVDFWNNHYGEDDPGDCDIGAPRQGCPAP